MESNKNFLLSTFDAKIWAKEFKEIDEDLMHVWFACSLMTGYDFARNKFSIESEIDNVN